MEVSLHKNMENPFEYQRVVTGERFVDRREEIKILTNSMIQGENLILFSPRRLGKTSLLKEAMRRITEKRTIVYIDLFGCTNEKEICERITNAVINGAYTKIEKAVIAIKEFIKSAKPTIVLGKEGIELRFEFFEKEKTLRDVLKMIQKISNKKNRKMVAIIDECQIMAEIEGLEAIFRSEIQEQNTVCYIFSGSKMHVLEAMIKDKNRPFYRQLRPFSLGLIPKEEFNPFIKKKFSKVAKIDQKTLEEIHRFDKGNPQRTQQICHWLFSKVLEGANLNPALVEEAVKKICSSLDKEFETEFDSINNLRQKRIINALAIEEIKKPLSDGFINKYDLGPSSTVYASLKRLVEKGILDEKYGFVDPLFGTWILFRHERRL